MTDARQFNSYSLDPLKAFGVGFEDLPILISDGMGVESATIVAKLADDPGLLPGFSWERAIVITAQTGGEYKSTKRLRERHILPILRDLGVRTVQVARHGPKEEDGITVLDDTPEPYTVYIQGDYTLEQELRTSGIVPSFGGVHTCSIKSKAVPIETWRFNEFGAKPYRHVFGYSSQEQGRMTDADRAVIKRNDKALSIIPHRMFLGYNSSEQKRIKEARSYDTEYCINEYPLGAWGMDRGACIEYLLDRFGVVWKKSACRFCVFCKVNEDSLRRWREECEGAGESLFTEYISLCMNPRGTLFRNGSMYSFIERDGNEGAMAHFYDLLDRSRWGLFEVRRIYSKKGKAMRAVEKLREGTRTEMERLFEQESKGLTLKEEHGIGYAYVQEREAEVYPAFEHFKVVAPADVNSKTHFGFDHFNAKWNALNPTGQFFPITGTPQIALFGA
ncbi:MAG TPA: hypothetical protein VF507_02730 [Pyrinomonadaceae bacterium]